MRIENLKKISSAPEKGQALVYTMDRVCYGPYGSLEDVRSMAAGKEILEMHLFDDMKEYRCIATESRRFPSGMIEAVIGSDGFSDENVYKEICLTEDGNRLVVLNHVSDDENGMAAIDGYRLKKEEWT